MICSGRISLFWRCSVLSLSTVLLMLRGQGLSAQEYKYELGAALGASYYVGDAVRRGPLGMYSVGGSALGRYNINFRTAFVSSLGYLGLRGHTELSDNAFPNGRSAAFKTHSLQWMVGGEYNFFPLSDRYRYLQTSSWSPYIGIGGLASLAWGDASSVIALGAYLACGIKYMLSSRMSLGVQWQAQYYLSDRLDALDRGNAWLGNPFALNRGLKGGDAVGMLSLSFTYHIGLRSKDSCYSM
ncbi:MAG: hypothetical protein Q4A61_03310 [Porphyromonadaceae bacterium]|nr:hypothetical protein [Porphyromonadaceae bacterium]